MKVVYTEQSLDTLEETLNFLIDEQKIPFDKVLEIQNKLLNKADSLTFNPYSGQFEEYLEHLNKGHRRLIEGHFKIIYRIEDQLIFITEFFDTRQDPSKMKG